jgi:hypothetical protein
VDCREQRDFVRHVPKLNIIRKALNRLKNLLLHTHIQSIADSILLATSQKLAGQVGAHPRTARIFGPPGDRNAPFTRQHRSVALVCRLKAAAPVDCNSRQPQ